MMKCPECGNQNNLIIDSRYNNKQDRRWRRKECSDCGKRFTTNETHEVKPETVQALIESLQPEPPLQGPVDLTKYENQIIELQTQVEHEKGLRKEAQAKLDELEIDILFDQKHFVHGVLGEPLLQREITRLQGRLEREKQIRSEFENQLKIERSKIIKLKKGTR